MIGDINLFLYPDPSDALSDTDTDTDPPFSTRVVGELEIMIADSEARRRGFARESLHAFIAYLATNISHILQEYACATTDNSIDDDDDKDGKEKELQLLVHMEYLRVKIGQENAASLGLFKGLGFQRVGGVNYFGEVEMRKAWGDVVGEGERRVEVVRYGE
ncbi:hypothetical protein ACEQ8H_000234 [Pleosporales sp. CAS-2024a]